MEADLSLKTRQAFWETPRNIALLVTTVAAVAGLLGFKLGQHQSPLVVVQTTAAERPPQPPPQ
jgi:hypothetical protein